MTSQLVGAWPDQPRSAPREPGCAAPAAQHAFPSGRAAIVACLEVAGIGPESVVATPECVTGCLADAVRRRARPVSLRAGEQDAVVVYEQWGWPLPPDAEDDVQSRFQGLPVVVDRVDSADFFAQPRTYGAFEVLSLSKVLGLPAGGIARQGDAYLSFAPGASTRRAPGADRPWLLSHPAVRELFKQSDHVHPAVLGWLAQNCPLTALEAERRQRNAAALALQNSPLGNAWPAWMTRAIESGAGPVWAPVRRGNVRREAAAALTATYGVHVAVKSFNWSGNPLRPCYEPALALPIHGGLTLTGCAR